MIRLPPFVMRLIVIVLTLGTGASELLAEIKFDPAPSHAAVVKVHSYECRKTGDLKAYRQGSGILLRVAGRAFVLTSSHVPFHDAVGGARGRFCHRVYTGTGAGFEVSLTGANVLYDLALLAVERPVVSDEAGPATTLPSLDVAQARPATPAPGSPAVGIGFPFAAAPGSQARYYPGKIMNPAGHLTLLHAPSMVEIDGLSEYGNSGGAVFDQAGNLLAMISHQFLRINAGAETTLVEHGAMTGGGPIITLAIPLDFALGWIQDVLAKKPWADLRRVPTEPWQDELFVVDVGNLRFTQTGCKKELRLPVRAGIGGHGIGVGGAGSKGAVTADCFFMVKRQAARRQDETWPWPDTQPARAMRAALAVKDPAYFSSLSKGGDVESSENILHVFALLKDGYQAELSYEKPKRVPPSVVVTHDMIVDAERRITKAAVAQAPLVEKLVASARHHGLSGIERYWEHLDAGSKLLLYDAATRDQSLPSELRKKIYRLATVDAFLLQFKAEAEAVRIGLRAMINALDPWEHLWLILTTKTAHFTWMQLTHAERVAFWNEELSTDRLKATIYLSIFTHAQDPRLTEELRQIFTPHLDRTFHAWSAEVKKGTYQRYWLGLDRAQRYWVFLAMQFYGTANPVELNAFFRVCPDYSKINVDLPPGG